MIKLNNLMTVRLSDQEQDYLINLLNEKFELDNFSDAIRYCIRYTKKNNKITGEN